MSKLQSYYPACNTLTWSNEHESNMNYKHTLPAGPDVVFSFLPPSVALVDLQSVRARQTFCLVNQLVTADKYPRRYKT